MRSGKEERSRIWVRPFLFHFFPRGHFVPEVSTNNESGGLKSEMLRRVFIRLAEVKDQNRSLGQFNEARLHSTSQTSDWNTKEGFSRSKSKLRRDQHWNCGRVCNHGNFYLDYNDPGLMELFCSWTPEKKSLHSLGKIESIENQQR